MKPRETIKSMIKSMDKVKDNLDTVDKANEQIKESAQTLTELCAMLGVK